MFQSARLKLTAWYLLIIMFISILFSVAFYNLATREIERVMHRIEHEQQDPFHQFPFVQPSPPINIAALQESEQRLLLTLIAFDVGILILSGAAGYFLAGRTLRPIQVMVDEQNRFITDASHELRTPITALKSEIEVYMRAHHHTLKEADIVLTSNLEEVNNLQVLSDNLIQLAQFQKPNGNHVFTNVSVSEVLLASEKKLQSAAKQKSITIVMKIADYTLFGNKESLIQLFTILLDNAIKYSLENSTITITANRTDHSILVTISDQGIGIEKKDIPYIFDRFYRADSSRTKQTIPGYGLGLSIAKKIVVAHHGAIEVKSDSGKGTTFSVRLPYNQNG